MSIATDRLRQDAGGTSNVVRVNDVPLVVVDPVVRMRELVGMIGLCEATVWKMVAAGSFPQPMLLGERAVGWRASEINAFLDGLPRVCKGISGKMPEVRGGTEKEIGRGGTGNTGKTEKKVAAKERMERKEREMQFPGGTAGSPKKIQKRSQAAVFGVAQVVE